MEGHVRDSAAGFGCGCEELIERLGEDDAVAAAGAPGVVVDEDELAGADFKFGGEERIEVGVPAYQSPSAVTLGKILALPFARRGNDWVRPDGSPAARPPFSSKPTRLTE